jgi:hypothetical protein
MLWIAKSYDDIVNYVQLYRHGSTAALNQFIQLIAEAKGLPPRVEDEEAEAFFRRTAEEGTAQVQPSAAGDRHPPDTFQAGFCE